MRPNWRSGLAFACFAIATFAYVRADLAFHMGLDVSLTNLPYVHQVFSLLKSASAAPEASPLTLFALTERRIALLLVAASLLLCVASLALVVLARRANEPSQIYAGVGLFSLVVVAFGGRLLTWLEPWHVPF